MRNGTMVELTAGTFYGHTASFSIADALLTAGDVPLTEVAAACGFADQSHLTRVFAAHTGTTPARYRKRLRTR